MKPVVLAYRSAWNEESLPADRIDYKPLTHITHAFAAAGDGGVRFPKRKPSLALIENAHRHSVKVLLAIGGADSNKNLSALCATTAGTHKLAVVIAGHVLKTGYDGVDVDWETPENAADRDRLSRFTADLRKALPRPKMVTIAVPATDHSGKWFDAPALLPLVDWAAVMCYDFYGSWSERAGYHCALFPSQDAPPKADEAALTASGAIRYWRATKRFPASKLILGIPVYARGFVVPEWGAKAFRPMEKTYRELHRTADTTEAVDKHAVCATWAVDIKSGIALARYAGDNPDTAREKGAWAKRNRLAGVFFWELSQDGDGATVPSVIQAAKKGFETGPAKPRPS